MGLNLMAMPGLPEDTAYLVSPPLKSGIVIRQTKEGFAFDVSVAREDIVSGRIVVLKNIG